MMIRKLAERLARGRFFKRHINVDGSRFPIYVSPDAQLKYLTGAFDQDLIKIAENLSPDDIAWDIGGNIGVFAVAAASRGCSVTCVEADIWLAGLIRKTASLNSSCDIRVIPAAIADKPGVLQFNVAARGRASNALDTVGGNSQMGGVRETQYVPVLTLDSLLPYGPFPTFIKIDVEGAELLALQGAKKTLSEVRPLIYCEINEANSDSISSLLVTYDYELITPSGAVAEKNELLNVYLTPKEKGPPTPFLRLSNL